MGDPMLLSMDNASDKLNVICATNREFFSIGYEISTNRNSNISANVAVILEILYAFRH